MKGQDDDATRVILVRHGQTEWNRAERFRGRTDIEPNEAGHNQARAIGSRLRSWKIDAIYSGPLKRALQTAQPIAEACELEVQRMESLSDIDYGAWTGHSPAEVASRYADLYREWLDTPHLVQMPDGETLAKVQRRALDALESVCLRHGRQSAVLVSHQVVNRVLICAILGLSSSSLWQIGQDNAAISIVDATQGEYRLLLLNDTCHLRSLDHDRHAERSPTPHSELAEACRS